MWVWYGGAAYAQSHAVLAQELLQRVCAAYHACLAEFRRKVPTDFYTKEVAVIEKGNLVCKFSCN